jgi:streptogramin lyase
MVTVCLALAACSAATAPTESGSSIESAASVPASTAASVPPSGTPVTSLEELDALTVSLEGGPDWPAILDDSVWILAPDGALGQGEGELVYRLDARTGEEQARVPIDGRLCQGIAAGFGSLWACTDGGLVRIDPDSNEVVTEIPFQVAQVFVRPVMTEDRVWMLAGNVFGNLLVEIDPRANDVVATHELGHTAAGLAFGDGALWATVPAEGVILRIDPSNGRVRQHTEGLTAPVTIAYGGGSLWVAEHGEGEPAAAGEPTIARVSPADGSVEARIAIGPTSMEEGDIWAGDDSVWVRNPGDPFLVRIDPATNQVVTAIGGSFSGGSLTVSDGVVWTTSIELATAWRIEP